MDTKTALTDCYGLFWTRSTGTPNAAKLIDDRVYWDLDDARDALATMDLSDDIEIRRLAMSVGSVVEA